MTCDHSMMQSCAGCRPAHACGQSFSHRATSTQTRQKESNMSGPFSVHKFMSIDVPFTILDADGSPNTTITATVSSSNPSVRVGILPGDNRTLFVDGLDPTAAANVVVSATIGGQVFSNSFLVGVLSAANLGAVSVGATASAEYPTPASR